MSFSHIPSSIDIARNLQSFKTDAGNLVSERFDFGLDYADQTFVKSLEVAEAIQYLAGDIDTIRINLGPLDNLTSVAEYIKELIGELEPLQIAPGDMNELIQDMSRIVAIVDGFDDPFVVNLDGLEHARAVVEQIKAEIQELSPVDFVEGAYSGAIDAINAIRNNAEDIQPVEVDNAVLDGAEEAIAEIKATTEIPTDPAITEALASLNVSIEPINPPTLNVTPPRPSDYNIDTSDLTPPALAFVWEAESIYTSTMLSLLQAELKDDISGSQVISAAVEAAMFARETERDLEVLSDAKARVEAEWAEYNWPMPDGVMAYNMNQLETAYDNKMLDKARAIQEQTEKLALENMWKSRELGSTLEKVLMEFVGNMMARKLEAAKANLMAVVEMFRLKVTALEAKLRVFLGMVQMYTAEIDMAIKTIQLDITVVEANVRLKVARAQLLAEKVRLLLALFSEQNKIKLGGIEAIQRVAEKRTDARIEESRLVIANFTEAMRLRLGAMDSVDKVVTLRTAAYTEQTRMAVQELVERVRLRMQAMTDIEGITSSKAKTLMTQIGALVSQFTERVRARITGAEAATRVGAIQENLLLENSKLQLMEFLENMKLRLGGTEVLERISAQKMTLVLQKAQIEITQYLEQVRLKLGALGSVATTLAQIAAGAMAGMSATAHVSSGDSTSTGANISYVGQESKYTDETPNE